MQRRYRISARDRYFEEGEERVEGVLRDLPCRWSADASSLGREKNPYLTFDQALNTTGNQGFLYRIAQNTIVTKMGKFTTVV